jgi:hypothetical protein
MARRFNEVAHGLRGNPRLKEAFAEAVVEFIAGNILFVMLTACYELAADFG